MYISLNFYLLDNFPKTLSAAKAIGSLPGLRAANAPQPEQPITTILFAFFNSISLQTSHYLERFPT